MERGVRRSLWIACVVGLVACNRGDQTEAEPAAAKAVEGDAAEPAAVDPAHGSPAEGATARAATPGPGDAELLHVIEALGDEGAVVLVLRPQHWAGLHGALASWWPTLPSDVAAPLRAAREPTALPGVLALPLGVAPGTLTLEGWDVTRPVVASLGEVPYDGPPGAVTPQLPAPDGWMLPLRHQVWLPATDPAALTASLGAGLEPLGKPFPALVAGREGARAMQTGDLAIAVLPGRDAVRVVVFQAMVGQDDATRLAHMRSRLDTEARPPMSTPALGLLAQPDAVLSGWLRAWRLRPLAAWSGGVEIVRALAEVSEDHRALLMARGMQIVLAAELLMTDEGAELDDTAMSVVVDEGVLRLRSAMSLTPEGEAIMQAATRGAGRALAAKADDAWIDAVLQADGRALLDATAPPPAFAATKDAIELARAVQEGGYFATIYMGLRHPFGVLRAVEQLAKTERLPLPIDMLPTAARVVWRGMDGEVPRVALAVHWPKDYVDRPLAAMVPVAKGERGFESLRMDTLQHEGRPVTVFGLAGESASTFDHTEGGGFEGLAQVRVSLARIGADLATRQPEVGALLAGAGEVRLTLEHRGKALVSELAWDPGGGAVQAKAVPVPEEGGWASPMGSPVGKGTTCLAVAGRTVARGLEAQGMVADDQRGIVGRTAMLEAESALRCAADDPVTAAAAAALRRLMARLIEPTP